MTSRWHGVMQERPAIPEPPRQAGPTPIRPDGAKVRPSERVLLSIKEAAELLSLGERTLHRALRDGEIPLPVIVHFGSQRIARTDLDAYVARLPRRDDRRRGARKGA